MTYDKNKIYSREEFDKLTRVDMHKLWFRDALTERKIASMFGVTKEEVHDKRKEELGLTWLGSAFLWLMNPKYRK